jgi:hypothetical protein
MTEESEANVKIKIQGLEVSTKSSVSRDLRSKKETLKQRWRLKGLRS